MYPRKTTSSRKYISLRNMGMVTMKAKRSSSSVLMNRQINPFQLRWSTLFSLQLRQSCGVIMIKPKMAMKATEVSRRKMQYDLIMKFLEQREQARQAIIRGTRRQFKYHIAYESMFYLFLYNSVVSREINGKPPLNFSLNVLEIFHKVITISIIEKAMISLLELYQQTQRVRITEKTSSQKRVLRDTPLFLSMSLQNLYSCLIVKKRRMV